MHENGCNPVALEQLDCCKSPSQAQCTYFVQSLHMTPIQITAVADLSSTDKVLQYSYAGTATDRPLMEWLGAYAFPREKAHSDTEAARAEYDKLAARLLEHGTTTALLFGTMHRQACQQLALTFQQHGLRAFVGKVCMDRSVLMTTAIWLFLVCRPSISVPWQGCNYGHGQRKTIQACQQLALMFQRHGLLVFVGKVCMDRSALRNLPKFGFQLFAD